MRRAPGLHGTGHRPVFALVVFAIFFCVSAPGCVQQPMPDRTVSDDKLDHRMSMNTYIEEGALVALGVNTDATRRREDSPLIPLGVTLANNGLPRLTVNRESFTLVDDTGHGYPMAGLGEFGSLGNQPIMDLQVSARFGELFAQRFEAMTLVPSVFFPIPVTEPGRRRRGVVAEEIEVPRQHWMIDVIYFPHPQGQLVGRTYELWFTTRELADPVFVRFSVD